MKSEINLHVHAVFPDGEVVGVGRLLSRGLNRPGRFEGFFRYDPNYLRHPKAYAVDPVHLPLSPGTFAADNGEIGLHRVFDDSLPDAWGRQLLARKGGLAGRRPAPAHLLAALGNGGLGRLLFTERNRELVAKDTGIAFSRIALALEEARKLENDIAIADGELRHLLACGSSAGGARPKVLTSWQQGHWIAKLASVRDPEPALFIALEEAGLILAARAGLTVPELRRQTIEGRDLLLLRRFDVTAAGGRNALVSFRTLLDAEDPYLVAYSDLATAVARYSVEPAADLELLYQQMAVNVLLRNTDDHLQNFSLLHTEEGWRLSPAYDIVPNIYQPGQILQVNGKHEGIGREDLISEGRGFGFSAARCRQLLQAVVDALAPCWEEVFKGCGVPGEHTGKLRQEIRERFSRCAAGL
jgi:serine/threonine-protein kinase HipA